MSFLQGIVEFNKIKRTLYTLSFLWLLLISSITCVSCFDVSVSPGSICCGDWVTVTISLTNNGGSVFSGRLEIYIIDANGYQDRMDGLSITLQPHESRTFQTRIRPKDCKSYGTYQVVARLVDNNGREQGTRTSSFVVKDPASCKSPGCTWTFTCDSNVVKRLCVDQNGKEYWEEYDDCNKYNPPRKCINGVCVDIPPTCNQQTCPPPSQCIDGRCEPPCDQQACQNQNRPIGTPYTKNGLQYQKYMVCSCVNNQCKCEEVEKEFVGSDLKVVDVKFDEEPIAGKPIHIIATIKNIGDAADKIKDIRVFCKTSYEKPIQYDRLDTVYDSDEPSYPKDENIGKILNPGESCTSSISWIAVPLVNVNGDSIIVGAWGEKEPLNNYDNNNFMKTINVKRNIENCHFDIGYDAYSFPQIDVPLIEAEKSKGLVAAILSDLGIVNTLYGKVPIPHAPLTTITYLLGTNPSNGFCFGLSSTCIIYYKLPDKKPISKSTFNLLAEDTGVSGNIYEYHAKQSIYDIIEWGYLHIKPSIDMQFTQIKAYININDPVIFTMWNADNSIRHSVVAFDFYEVDSNTKNIVVYDPNYPGIARIVKLDYANNRISYQFDENSELTNGVVEEPVL